MNNLDQQEDMAAVREVVLDVDESVYLEFNYEFGFEELN